MLKLSMRKLCGGSRETENRRGNVRQRHRAEDFCTSGRPYLTTICQRHHKHCYYVSSQQEFGSKISSRPHNSCQSPLFTDVSIRCVTRLPAGDGNEKIQSGHILASLCSEWGMFVDVMIFFLGICSDSTFWQPYLSPLSKKKKKRRLFCRKL